MSAGVKQASDRPSDRSPRKRKKEEKKKERRKKERKKKKKERKKKEEKKRKKKTKGPAIHTLKILAMTCSNLEGSMAERTKIMTATSSESSRMSSGNSSSDTSHTKARHLAVSYSAWPFTMSTATAEKSHACTNSLGSVQDDIKGNTVFPTPHPTSSTRYLSLLNKYDKYDKYDKKKSEMRPETSLK